MADFRCQPAQHATSRFRRRVALPIATLVGAAMLAVVVFVGYSAARQSDDAREQSILAMRNALNTKVEEITRTAQDYSWWNDAVIYLDLNFDRAWADGNIGRYIHDTFGYDATFVIGREGRTRYATIDGEPRAVDAFQLAPELEELVARARAIPPDQPGAAAGYLVLDGAVAIVGSSPITPDPVDPIDAPGGPRPVLIYAQRLDHEFLDPIADSLALGDLHIAPPQPAAGVMLPLRAADGADLGGLAWQPPPLGQEFIRDILPSLVLVFCPVDT